MSALQTQPAVQDLGRLKDHGQNKVCAGVSTILLQPRLLQITRIRGERTNIAVRTGNHNTSEMFTISRRTSKWFSRWYAQAIAYKACIKIKVADTTEVLRKTKSLMLLMLISRSLEAAFAMLFDCLPKEPAMSANASDLKGLTRMSEGAVRLLRDYVHDIQAFMSTVGRKFSPLLPTTHYS